MKSQLENLHKENIKETLKMCGIYKLTAEFCCFGEDIFTYRLLIPRVEILYEIKLKADNAILFKHEKVQNLFNIDNLIYFGIQKYYLKYGNSVNLIEFKVSDFQNENYLQN